MYQDIYHVYKDGNKLDTHGNKFGYLGYPFFCFFPVSTPRMEMDGIRMETDLDILDIYFSVSLLFPWVLPDEFICFPTRAFTRGKL